MDEATPGLQGPESALAVFFTMLLATGPVLDIVRSVRLGAVSVAVTALGLWLMFRVLKSGRPRLQRLAGATLLVVLVLLVRFGLSKVLVG